MPLDTLRDSPADELGCTAGFGTGTTPASYSHSVGAGRPFHAACRKHASQGLIPSQRTRLLAPRKGRSDQFSPLSRKAESGGVLSHVRQASVRGVDVVWRGWVRRPTRLVELMAGATTTRRGVDLSEFRRSSSARRARQHHPATRFSTITRNMLFQRAFYLHELQRAYSSKLFCGRCGDIASFQPCWCQFSLAKVSALRQD